jgi:omega-6 fatty acid desaturase (delta-12 desaturase)
LAHQPDGFELRRRAMVRDYGRGCNLAGLGQCLTTLLPLALLWWLAAWSLAHRPWLAIPATLCITLYLVRVFALMHECGHGALFSSRPANRVAGFVMGVISGMPQYVWAQHHDHHHRTNGNWERYRGPLTTASVDEYAAMSPAGRRRYRLSRHIALAPLGGFVYLVFNPRCNWLKGSLALGLHLLGGRPVADFRTRYWKTWREYLHMTANNVVLLSLWWAMSQAIGVGPFFAIYLTSLSLAGGIGIMLFTVQHNFEHAYAAPTATWDFDAGAMRGTSFLVLPGWLNWFTANIGYHHVHHLSAAIPNYHLVKCHSENADLFGSVRRLRLADVPGALQCLLWDRRGERIISFAQYEAEAVAAQPRQRPRIPGR